MENKNKIFTENNYNLIELGFGVGFSKKKLKIDFFLFYFYLKNTLKKSLKKWPIRLAI